MDVLKEAYFLDPNNATATRKANIELASDIQFINSILRSAILQTYANNRDQHKNTFLMR